MLRDPRSLHHLVQLTCTLLTLLVDAARFLRLCLRSPAALAAENLFLHKQLALYQERHSKPRHATDATRITLIWLAQWFDWRQALTIVQPATFTRWHRQGFRLFWSWKSHPGRPPIPVDLQALICRMAQDNPTWGQERIANELLLKLGLRVSPRTARKYMPTLVDRKPGQRVLKTPPQSPQANALCERLIGTLRRECLDFVIPLTVHHVQRLLAAWVPHSNHGCPHMSLGPGIPQPPPPLPMTLHAHRHRLPPHLSVVSRSVLGGLHHEYELAERTA